MRVDAHVSSSARQRFVFSVRDMFTSLGVNIFFGQAKIYYMQNIRLPRIGLAKKKVFWLDVSVNQMFRMNVFYPIQLWIKKRLSQMMETQRILLPIEEQLESLF